MPPSGLAKAKVASSNLVFRSKSGPGFQELSSGVRGFFLYSPRRGSGMAVTLRDFARDAGGGRCTPEDLHRRCRSRHEALTRELRGRLSHVFQIDVRVAVGHLLVQVADDLLDDPIGDAEFDEERVGGVA